MNKENVVLDELTHKDHQIVLAIIYWLENCHSREVFNQIVKTTLIPLFACSGVFYINLASRSPQLLGSILPFHSNQSRWNGFVVAAMRTITAENHVSDNVLSIFDARYPNGLSHYQINESETLMVVSDDPEQSIMLCFCHQNVKTSYFSTRHIEILKLLRPILLQSINTILSCENIPN